MTIKIGEVIAINGVKITLKIYDESNKDTLFYDGEKYKGVSIREYISIKRGFRNIICMIEGEYLDENRFDDSTDKKHYIRKVEVKPIGYFEEDAFYEGIKFLPMIKDSAYLLQEKKISEIYSRGHKDGFIIGEMLKEEIPISLPWQKLFNSHIGIFGNTGSGKSNTLAKLYTVLFKQKRKQLQNKSKFVILDFNGEYTSDQLVGKKYKTTLHLNTKADGNDKFPLDENEFWNPETLSILFQATAFTQRPFLNRIITGRERFLEREDSLLIYIKSTYKDTFSAASPKPDTLDLLRNITNILKLDGLSKILNDVSWHGQANKFTYPKPNPKVQPYFFDPDGENFEKIFRVEVDKITANELYPFDELVIRANIQLVKELIHGYVQFDHIQPLLKRIDSSLSSLRKVLSIDDNNQNTDLLTVISLRNCNQEIKKIMPLLIAKHFYHQHKDSVENPPNKTMHLIIDEAHNILSQQSTGESESWKDYRLELFEEIIKEGRKFGMFLTLASQRPADISPTITSQIHNFFIHRLVNDRDLFLLDNSISTLDNLSRSLIPNLSKGSCIVTGTSFDLPMILQIHRLKSKKRPDSEDVDLKKLWS